MPAPTYVIDPDRRLVRLQYKRPPRLPQWIALINDFTMDARFRSGYNIVEDMRALRVPPDGAMVEDGTRQLEALASRLKPCRWAAVFSPELLSVYGQVRMSADRLRKQQIEVCVFMDYEAALRWATEPGFATAAGRPPRYDTITRGRQLTTN